MTEYARAACATPTQRDVTRGRLCSMGASMRHKPVMIDEVKRFLIHKDSKLILDATVSCGGHARAILESNPSVELIGVDVDADAIRIAEGVLTPFAPRFRLFLANYAEIPRMLDGSIVLDGVLLDLGLSSLQLDEPGRGFSYQHTGPLDMRMSGEGITAEDLINDADERQLRRILEEYGELSGARRIARAIKDASNRGQMSSTTDLRRVVESVLGRRATPAVLSRVFQAIRIAVNNELENIEGFLNGIVGRMNKGGRIVVVSYHSLEDRLVKEFFRAKSARCVCPPQVPVCVCGRVPTLELLTRRVVKPSAGEVERNPRSRSARLRAAAVIH